MTQSNTSDYQVGYKKPPRKTQFAKGQSGNPHGRPKRPEAVSITELLNGEQRGRNGEVISRREALVIKLLNDAMSGKQKAFARFLKYMIAIWFAGKRNSASRRPGHSLPNRPCNVPFACDLRGLATKERKAR